MPFNIIKYDIVDDEVETAILYYESVSFDLGLRFEKEMENALVNLEQNPAYYFNLEDNKHRRIVIEGFPYAFIYCIEGNRVLVKMLFPQKEDPAKLWAQIRSLR